MSLTWRHELVALCSRQSRYLPASVNGQFRGRSGCDLRPVTATSTSKNKSRARHPMSLLLECLGSGCYYLAPHVPAGRSVARRTALLAFSQRSCHCSASNIHKMKTLTALTACLFIGCEEVETKYQPNGWLTVTKTSTWEKPDSPEQVSVTIRTRDGALWDAEWVKR